MGLLFASGSWVRTAFVVGFLASLLVACDEYGELSAQEFVKRAEKAIAEGDRRASIIELKNALQKKPDHAAARLMLGTIYLEIGDGASAEKEIVRARELGATFQDYAGPLGRSWLLRGKQQQVLDEIDLQAAKTPPLKAKIYNLRGRARMGLNELDAAREEFEASLATETNNTGALVGLANLALRRNESDTAAAYVDKALKAAPEEPEVISVSGAYHFAGGRYAEAVKAYLSLVGIRPENLSHRVPLANAQIMDGKAEAAVKTLAPVLKVAPKHPPANYLRALAAYRLKQYREAKDFSQRVLAVAPRHLPSQLLAGATSYALEEFEQANSHLTKFLAQAPEHEPARRLHGATLLRLGHTSEALAALKPLTDDNVGDPQLLAMVGTAAMRSGDYESGRKYFKQFAALRPDNAEVHERLGALELGVGNIEQGIEELERALELDPKSDRALIALFAAQIRAKKFDDALATAERVQENRPDSPTGHTLAGIALMGKQDTTGARAAFEKALEIKPGTPDASANLAALELREKKPDLAREVLMEALNRNPGHLRTLIRLAQLEDRFGDRRQTRNWLEQALESNPDSVATKVLLARIHVREGRPRDALTITREAIQAQPKNVGLLTVVGQAQLIGGQARDAAATFRRLVAERPKAAQAHFLLAIAHGGLRDRTRQEEELKAALALDAKHLRAKLELAGLKLRQRDADAAEALLAELKETAPKNDSVVALEARLALARRRYGDAVGLYRRAMERRATTEWTLGLSEALWRTDDRQASLKILEDWLERVPADQRVRFALATRYLTDKRYGVAKTNFETVVEAAPNNWIARNNLAWLLWHAGDAKAALPHAERALDLVPDNAGVQDTAGAILLDLGQTERAARLLRRAAEGAPKNNEIKVHLAQALAKQGEAERARRLLREALSGDEAFTGRAEAEALLRELGG